MKNLIAVVMVMLSSGICFAATPKTAELTPDERELINRGEISTGSYVVGGVIGTVIGLGIGNAIQGRYMPNGLIFTLGEVAGAVMWGAGTGDCLANSITAIGTNNDVKCHDALATTGAVILIGLHIWEIIDNWAMPPAENSRYRNLKARMDGNASAFKLSPTIHSDDHGMPDGGGFALSLSF